MENGNNKNHSFQTILVEYGLLQLFVSFHESPQFGLKFGDVKKNAFIHFSQVDLLTMKVLRANPSQEVFSAVCSGLNGWCIVSWYNWIIEPFHQLIPYTIVGQQQNTCPSLYIRPCWTNTSPLYCPKDSQAVWGWLTRRPICGSLSGHSCFLGPLPLVGSKKIEFVSMGNIPNLFQYVSSKKCLKWHCFPYFKKSDFTGQ